MQTYFVQIHEHECSTMHNSTGAHVSSRCTQAQVYYIHLMIFHLSSMRGKLCVLHAFFGQHATHRHAWTQQQRGHVGVVVLKNTEVGRDEGGKWGARSASPDVEGVRGAYPPKPYRVRPWRLSA